MIHYITYSTIPIHSSRPVVASYDKSSSLSSMLCFQLNYVYLFVLVSFTLVLLYFKSTLLALQLHNQSTLLYYVFVSLSFYLYHIFSHSNMTCYAALSCTARVFCRKLQYSKSNSFSFTISHGLSVTGRQVCTCAEVEKIVSKRLLDMSLFLAYSRRLKRSGSTVIHMKMLLLQKENRSH